MKNSFNHILVIGILLFSSCAEQMNEPDPLRIRVENLTNFYIDSLSIGVVPETSFRDVSTNSLTEYIEVERAWGTIGSMDVFLKDTVFQWRSFDVLSRLTEGDFTYELFIDTLTYPPNLFYKVNSDN